jgi:hypothetical protein
MHRKPWWDNRGLLIRATFAAFLTLAWLSVATPATLPSAMFTVAGTPTGPGTLCQSGPPTAPSEKAGWIQVLDNPVWFTIDSPTSTPGASNGGQLPAGTVIVVDKASQFRAVQVTGAARIYAVCVDRLP